MPTQMEESWRDVAPGNDDSSAQQPDSVLDTGETRYIRRFGGTCFAFCYRVLVCLTVLPTPTVCVVSRAFFVWSLSTCSGSADEGLAGGGTEFASLICVSCQHCSFGGFVCLV